MKKHLFAVMIAAASLLMGAAAWALKNVVLAPRAVGVQTPAQVSPAAGWLCPVDGAAIAEPFGPVWDENLGQWSLRERAALRAERGAFVRAAAEGRVAESREEDGAWLVTIRHEDGTCLCYGGLRAGLALGRRVARGELIGQLAGDTLTLGRQAEGVWRDPTEILPEEPGREAGILPPGVE